MASCRRGPREQRQVFSSTATERRKGVRMHLGLSLALWIAPVVIAQPVIDFPVSDISVYRVTGANADCTAITMYTVGQSVEGYVWDESQGRRAIPVLPDYFQTRAYGMSSDGRYVTVQHVRINQSPNRALTRFDTHTWTHELVGTGPNNSSVDGLGISGDGGTLPISQVSVTSPTLAMWRPATNQTVLHTFSGAAFVAPKDASHDGSVIVGDVVVAVNQSAFRFRNGFQFLQSVLPNEATRASAVSADGNVILGQSGASAAVWINDIPSIVASFPEANSTLGLSLNAAATVAGGSAELSATSQTRAWIWSSQTGPVDFQNYLASLGLAAPQLRSVDAISDDGLRFVGVTADNRAYRVTLQTPIAGLIIPAPASSLIAVVGLMLGCTRRRT
jgi:uncharacterized membrane protein